jgi:hypothetical protein
MFHASVECGLEDFHRFLACHIASSVIEEKGEGFENGKTCLLAYGAPSTSGPPYRVVRLNTQATIKTLLNAAKVQTE